eukprot:c45698_g1_i1.p1 GENE.c45698_g1_i1~~c45698_g1_i1.p1  ORF type:complete len:355 (-),score=78.01 c45698_g1_i1:377-1441(-)
MSAVSGRKKMTRVMDRLSGLFKKSSSHHLLPSILANDLSVDTFPLDDITASKLITSACEPATLSPGVEPMHLFREVEPIYLTDTSSINDSTTSSGERVILKKVRIRDDPDLQSYVDVEIAMSVLCGFCDHVVSVYSVLRTETEVWMVLEVMEPGSLACLRDFMPMMEADVAYIVQQVLKALVYLRERHRVHRDIKGDNVLINRDGQVKLTDFGWATQLTNQYPHTNLTVGSVYWMSPEVARGDLYAYDADIWSLGIFAIEMFQGQPPLFNLENDEALAVLRSNAPAPALPENISPEFKSFLCQCLDLEPRNRPSAAQLLQHDFITQIGHCSHEDWYARIKQALPNFPVLGDSDE